MSAQVDAAISPNPFDDIYIWHDGRYRFKGLLRNDRAGLEYGGVFFLSRKEFVLVCAR